MQPGSLSCWILLLLERVAGWDFDGHEAVGMTAMSASQQSVNVRMRNFFGGGDLADVAKWAASLHKHYPGFVDLRFQMQPSMNLPQLDLTYSCPDGRCLINATKYFYARLAGVENLPQFQLPPGLKLTKIDTLKIIAVLISELHQPMFFGRLEDMSGRNITGTFFNGESASPTTAFDYWNSGVVDFVKTYRPLFWNSGWTNVGQFSPTEISDMRKKWGEASHAARMQMIEDWAQESYEIASKICYVNASTNQQIESGFNFAIRENILNFEYVKRRMLLAGLRLAIVIEKLVIPLHPMHVHAGTGVFHEEKSGPAHRRAWLQNAMINFSIFGVVLLLFAYVTRFFSSPLTSYGTITHDKSQRSVEMAGKRS